MTAHYSIFKDNTRQAEEPSAGGQFVGVPQCYAQTRLQPPVGTHAHHPNSVVNLPNTRRGHDVNGG